MVALWAKSGTIIGPDGEQYPRGGTNAANGNVFYNFGGGGGAAQQVAGTGATSDAAWFRFVFDQYPEGGLFIVGPTKAGHENGFYFSGNPDAGEFCDVPYGNVQVLASRGSQFRIADNKTSSRVFQVSAKTNFSWSGGTFFKNGAVSITGQSFFLVSGASHNFRIERAYFELTCTNVALNNFYCVSITGPSDPNFLACLRFPEVLDCEARFNNSQQSTASANPINGSLFGATTHFGGGFLKLFNTRGGKVRGNRVYGDQDAAATRYCGTLYNIDNEEDLEFADCRIWGLNTFAADGTANDFIILGTGVSGAEGSHFHVHHLRFHSAEARFLIRIQSPLYANMDHIDMGRIGCCAGIYMHPSPFGVQQGRCMNLDGITAHNFNTVPLNAEHGGGLFYGTPGDYSQFHTGTLVRADSIIGGFNLGQVTVTYFANSRKILYVGAGTKNYKFNVRDWMIDTQPSVTAVDHPVYMHPQAGPAAPNYLQSAGSSARLRNDSEA